ncbi:MAG: hypothetical protein WC810_14405 [Janthinobacterium sp.]|jgi:hypothetical protein
MTITKEDLKKISAHLQTLIEFEIDKDQKKELGELIDKCTTEAYTTNNDCSACNEYAKARVHEFCPAHRYCICDVGCYELNEKVWWCVECDKEVDPAMSDYYADMQSEDEIEPEDEIERMSEVL